MNLTNLEVDNALLLDITDAEFSEIASLVYHNFGIYLTDKKKALVRGRLNKILRDKSYTSFTNYIQDLKNDHSGLGLIELIDKISTNHTFFFRESDHFQFLLDHAFPEIEKKSEMNDEVRIWCAGCATGEEAYTLAMLAQGFFSQQDKRLIPKILATDISLTALRHGVNGLYTDERVRLIPEKLKSQYLKKLGPDSWKIHEKLKEMVLFKRLNFMEDQFPFKHQFHLIFCRNVMIYFDKETKNKLVKQLGNQLLNNHYFFIGHSETLGKDNGDFQYVRPSIYRKVPS